MKNAFHQRLKAARRMRGLSMDDLVQRMGGAVSKQSISKYERGLSVPRPHHLSLLLSALNIREEFFHRPTVELSDINYRCKGDISPVYKEQVVSVVTEKAHRYLDLENRIHVYPEFEHPLPSTQVVSYADIEQAARQLRSQWQMGEHPIPSVTHLLESKGFMIMEEVFEKNEILGLSACINQKRPVIVVNQRNHTTERKRFTLLHELAHLLLFLNKKTVDREDSEERLCERFAGALLCPAVVLERELGAHRTTFALSELISLRERYGISIAAIVHRCKDLGIISEQYYHHVFDHYIQQNIMEEGWGSYPVNEHTDRFHLLLQRAQAENLLSPAELMELNQHQGKENWREIIWE